MYYIIYQGRKQGPLSSDQLKTLIARGKIGRDTPISLDEENWTPIGEMKPCVHLLSAAPAPAPVPALTPAPPPRTPTPKNPPTAPPPPPAAPVQPSPGVVAVPRASVTPDVKIVTALPPTSRPSRRTGYWIGQVTLRVLLIPVIGIVSLAIVLFIDKRNANEEARIAAEAIAKTEQQASVAAAARAKEAALRAEARAEEARFAERARIAEDSRIVAEKLKEEADAKAAEYARIVAEVKGKSGKEAAEIAAVLDPLPLVWMGLPLERDRDYSGEDSWMDTLADSNRLLEMKDCIKLTLVPFVDLAMGPKPIKIDVSNPHRIDAMMDNKVIAIIELHEEKGLVFEWIRESLPNAREDHALINRLLLSSLRVSVGKQSRNIALFTPITMPAQRSRGALLAWKKDQKCYLLPPEAVKSPYQFAFGESEVPQFALENPQFANTNKLEMREVKPVNNWTTDKRFPDGFEVTVQMKGSVPQLPNPAGRLGLLQDPQKSNILAGLSLDARGEVEKQKGEAGQQIDTLTKNRSKAHNDKNQAGVQDFNRQINETLGRIKGLEEQLKSIVSLQRNAQFTFRLVLKNLNSDENIVLLTVEGAGDASEEE